MCGKEGRCTECGHLGRCCSGSKLERNEIQAHLLSLAITSGCNQEDKTSVQNAAVYFEHSHEQFVCITGSFYQHLFYAIYFWLAI